MNYFIRYTITYTICLISALRSWAATPQIESQIPITSGNAYCFCEDSKGFVWIGMLGELVRYDGLRIMKFPIPGDHATELRTNAIVPLGADALLLGGDYGLMLFELPSLTFGESVPAEGNPVYTMLGIGDDYALAGRAKGLMLMPQSLRADTIDVPGAVSSLSAAIYDMALAPDSTIWITTSYGIYQAKRQRGKEPLALKHVMGTPALHYSRIAATQDRLFIYTTGNPEVKRGLYCYDITDGSLRLIDDLNGMHVSCITVKGNRMYVSTDGAGIFIFCVATCRPIARLTNTSGVFRLSSNGIYSLYIDSRDNMFVGYYQNGVQVLTIKPESTFRPYADGDRFTTADLSVRATGRNARYNLTATLNSVMITDEELHTTHTLGTDSFDNTQPISIVPIGDQFAMGTFGGGVYIIDPSTAAISRIPQSAGLHVCDIALDRAGRIWVAANEGIFRFVDGKLDKTFTTENSCVKNGTIRIYFDRTGRGWIAGQNGMVTYDPLTDRVRDDLFSKGFINDEFVRCITESADGDLLFAYDRNKLFRSDLAIKNFGQVNHSLPLDNADINVMTQLADSSWMIASSSALYTTRDFRDFRAFGPHDGVFATKFSPSFAIDTVVNTLQLCTDRGLLVADIDRLAARTGTHTLNISEIRFNGERMTAPMPDMDENKINLRIPPHTGTIDIFFTDFTSLTSRPANIEYRLDGDSAWRTLPITRPVSVHYNGNLNRRVEVRPAGAPDSAVIISLSESSGHILLWWCVAIAVVACVVGIWIYRRKHHSSHKPAATIATDYDTAPIEETDNEKSTAKYRGFKVSDDELQRLAKRLDLLMYDSKIYRRADLKISQLAEELSVSTAVLSYYFSQYLKSNYYRYLNSYRIKDFKEMVADGTYHTYTLSAMSQMCGFGSRTSFFRYFKESEGISPLDYIKQAEDGNSQRSK